MAKKEKGKAKNNKKEEKDKNSKKAKETKKDKKTEKKEELKYDYEVKCLLIYQLKKGDLIELISNEISDISDFVMTLKVRVINNSSDIKKNNAEIKQIEKSENKKGKTVQTKRKGKKK